MYLPKSYIHHSDGWNGLNPRTALVVHGQRRDLDLSAQRSSNKPTRCICTASLTIDIIEYPFPPGVTITLRKGVRGLLHRRTDDARTIHRSPEQGLSYH